jgi:hypothetical protein
VQEDDRRRARSVLGACGAVPVRKNLTQMKEGDARR